MLSDVHNGIRRHKLRAGITAFVFAAGLLYRATLVEAGDRQGIASQNGLELRLNFTPPTGGEQGNVVVSVKVVNLGPARISILPFWFPEGVSHLLGDYPLSELTFDIRLKGDSSRQPHAGEDKARYEHIYVARPTPLDVALLPIAGSFFGRNVSLTKGSFGYKIKPGTYIIRAVYRSRAKSWFQKRTSLDSATRRATDSLFEGRLESNEIILTVR